MSGIHGRQGIIQHLMNADVYIGLAGSQVQTAFSSRHKFSPLQEATWTPGSHGYQWVLCV